MKLVLGVSGSIGAYKAVDIMRYFQKNGHEVTVVMTRAATRIIAPLTFATFAPGMVYQELFAEGQDPLLHINLSKENELLLVAPATANIIGKMANGIADDLLSTLFCAFFRRVVVAPAMNTHMLENPAVTDNIARLQPDTAGSLYLSGLGHKGLGQTAQGRQDFTIALTLKRDHRRCRWQLDGFDPH